LAITTAGLNEIEGLSAAGTGAVGGITGFCGAICAFNEADKHSKAEKTQRHKGKSAWATRLWKILRAGEGACGPQFRTASGAAPDTFTKAVRDNLIRNDLKNDCITQLRILLR
jgi:hypothetical protein